MTSARAARIQASPNFLDGRFLNPVPTRVMTPGAFLKTLRLQLLEGERRVPRGPLPIHRLTRADFPTPPGELELTWLGHSTSILDVDGRRVLMDPVWCERASPSQRIGPRRFHPPPLPLDQLPDVDAVLISHDHYDHLDKSTVIELAGRGMSFVTSLGVGGHLERWGVAPERITELDWHESTMVGDVRITATPARHFSGRHLFDRFRTLWSSWVLAGPRHRVFFTGDTGFFAGVEAIGRDHGPFDLTLIKIGAYSPTWPDVHLLPEDAARVHALVRGETMVAIHWGTFSLAFHPWSEPPERLLQAARAAGIEVTIPRPGQRIDPSAPSDPDPWWRAVP